VEAEGRPQHHQKRDCRWGDEASQPRSSVMFSWQNRATT